MRIGKSPGQSVFKSSIRLLLGVSRHDEIKLVVIKN